MEVLPVGFSVNGTSTKLQTASSCVTPFMQESVPLSALIVQKKRPYFFGRDYTETDVGYLAFFGAMHAIALVGGPLTFSWEALQVGRQFAAARPYALTR